jgi:2-polyprenyl-3-methyl-5-hydroxy-6-metoxy-1,4-benzoquinol methylase
LVCKNCNNDLKKEFDFINDKIEYKICGACTHLNGVFEDTDEFNNAVYTEYYSKNYELNDGSSFNYRLSSIYIPKAEFLYTSLLNDGPDPHNMKYLDFGSGSGSGNFVGALNKIGLKEINGTEVSQYQVDYGNKMIGSEFLSVHKMGDTNSILKEADADVISLIGVLEHLQDPIGALENIKNNSKVKYIYLSVPLFSLSVFIEMMNENVFHRQLHGSHTHLYTKKSLEYMAQYFDFDIISEWWFGADMVDLYRHIFVNLEKNKASDELIASFKEMLLPLIDPMQLELDKKNLSSEVHLLLKIK